MRFIVSFWGARGGAYRTIEAENEGRGLAATPLTDANKEENGSRIEQCY